MKEISCALLLLLACSPLWAVEVSRESGPGPDRIQGTARIQASISTTLAALDTPCAVRLWLPKARDIKVLQREGDDRTRIRMVTDYPWPWNDRAAVLEFLRQRSGPDRASIRMTALDEGAIPEGTVRITKANGNWQLHDQGEHLLLTYEQRFNTTGTVPQWLADKVAESQVRNALENLRQLVEGQARAGNACDWRPADADRPGDSGQSPELP